MFTFWPEDIQQNADRILYFNAEMGKKHTKNRVMKAKPELVIRSTRNDRSDYSGTTDYQTESLTVPNSTPIFCDFLIYFFYRTKKKLGSGPKS